jgi:hypothetical protein
MTVEVPNPLIRGDVMSGKSFWQVWMAALVAVGMLGCQGELPGGDGDPGGACVVDNDCPVGEICVDGACEVDPYAPCTDPEKCCPADKKKCYGDPDKGIICTCSDLWDCSKNPDKCDQDMPTPDGTNDWECTWSEFKYTCTKKGDKNTPPTGDSDWDCTYNEQEFKWECTKHPVPNPSNSPDGTAVWKCVVDNENNKLVCTKTGSSSTQPQGSGTWDCKDTTGDGVKNQCTKVDDNQGLPPGGSSWKCHKVVQNGKTVWVCYGETPQGGTPPGGSGWVCAKVKTEFGKDIWKCERKEDSGDYPPGGGWWSCYKGSEFGGTKCEKVDQPPTAPGPTPTPGQKCLIDEKMWCDGLVYCGWGQVDCDPATGTWRTITKNGKEMLDCSEDMAGGKVPNTVCACYHYFFNPSCCERPDCIVPPGTSGQVCPKSNGGLCDYCNPLKPECKESGAKCIVTNAHETFCGKHCPTGTECPAGYTCMTVKLKVGTTMQCVPADMSCYY